MGDEVPGDVGGVEGFEEEGSDEGADAGTICVLAGALVTSEEVGLQDPQAHQGADADFILDTDLDVPQEGNW